MRQRLSELPFLVKLINTFLLTIAHRSHINTRSAFSSVIILTALNLF